MAGCKRSSWTHFRTTSTMMFLLYSLLQLSLWGQCNANNLTEYQSGSGALDPDFMRPVAVENLNITYDSTTNNFVVTWRDLLNINDTNLGYRIVYDVTARGVMLASVTDTLLNVDTSMTNFQHFIPASDYSQDGVSVTVTVQACNDFGLGVPNVVLLTFMGDFAPPPNGFMVMANATSPSLTLVWNNAFDLVPPTGFEITYTATKLSGAPLDQNNTTATFMVMNVGLSASMGSDYSYTLSGLQFYTNYSVTIIAIYSDNQSSSVADQAVTVEGAPGPVQSLSLTFDLQPLSFDPDTRALSVSINITWTEPQEPNGNIITYRYTLTDTSGSIVLGPQSTTDTFVQTTVIVLPYEMHTVEVVGITAGGGEGVVTTSTALSPEAVPTMVQQLDIMVNDTHVIVTWDAPVDPNGVVSYNVTVSGINRLDNASVLNPTTVFVTETEYIIPHTSVPYSEYTAVVVPQTSAGSGPSQTDTVQTPEAVPTTVQQLNITINSTHVIVTWNAPADPNGVVSYNVTVSGINLLNNASVLASTTVFLAETEYIVPHTSVPYSEYTAVVVPQTSAGSGPSQTDTVRTLEAAPTIVQLLDITVNDTHVIVTWDAPADPNGAVSYNATVSGINLLNNASVLNPTTVFLSETEYIVPHTSVPYSEYTAVVVPQTSAGSGPSQTDTVRTLEAVPTAVQQLNIMVNDTHVIVTWDAPADPNGVVSYNVTVSGINLLNNASVLTSTPVGLAETEYIVSHTSVPYSEYTAVVVPQTSAGSGPSEMLSTQTDQEAPSAVLDLTANFIIDVPSSYNASSGLYEGTLNISWREPLTPNGVITNYNYLIIGPSPLTSTVVDDNNTDTTVQVGIGLTPDETYTISVTASTIAGPGPSSTVNITVPEAVPTAVQQLNIMVNDTHVIVTWDAPTDPNGVVSYTVTVSGINLLDNASVLASTTVIVTETEYTIPHTSVPYSEYTAVVVPQTSAGSGPSEMLSTQTVQEVPTVVQLLNITVNDTHVIVTWDAPADPNGVVSYNVTVSGINLIDDASVLNLTTVVLAETEYTIPHTSVPYSEYTAVVVPQTSAGSGPSQTDTVQTPEAVPTAVQQLNIMVNDTHVIVTWDAPTDPNGVVSYNVTVSGINLLNNASVLASTTVILAETEYIDPHTSVPYSEYTAVVVPQTSAGSGPSQTDTVQTPEAAPTAVQNLEASLIIDVPSSYNTSSGLYEGTLNISWREPLTPNGVITNYNYLVTGPSPLTSTVVDDNAADTTVQVGIGLTPDETYTISVTASTMGGPGPSSTVNITVPEAAPSEVMNLSINIINSSTLEVTWAPPLRPNGALTYSVTLSYTDLATSSMEMVFQRNETDRRVIYTSAVSDLEPYVMYGATVFAFTSVGNSPARMESIVTEDGVSEPPLNLMADPSNTTVSVVWSPPTDANGVILHYLISLSDSMSTMVNNSTLTVEFIGLLPFTNYSVSVRAFTGDGGTIEGMSVMQSFMTDMGVPTLPTSLSISVFSSTILNVTWDAPSMLNAPTVTYILQYRIVDNSSAIVVTGIVDAMFSIVDLKPFSNYSVVVQACSEVGCSPFTEEVTAVTIEGVPSVVRSLSITIVNSSTLQITWDPPLRPNGVLTYNITLSYTDLSTSQSVTVLNIQNMENNRMVVYRMSPDDLEPYARYDVVVIAMTNRESSSPVTSNVITDQDVSEPPRNLTVDPSNTTVSVMWSPPADANGVILHYLISLSNSMSTMVNNSTLTVEFTGLVPFTNYSVSVRAFTGDGGTIEGMSVMQSFMTDMGAPSAPNITFANATSSTSIYLEWAEPAVSNGIIQTYIISYYITTPSAPAIQTITTTNRISTLTELDVVTSYTVFVQAMTVVVGAASNTVTVTTLEDIPDAPDNVMAMEINSTSVNVTWSIPTVTNGVIVNYMVYYAVEDNGVFLNELTVEVEAIQGASMQSIVLHNLTEFTSYRISVTASTNIGEGNRSTSASVTTDPDSASPPSFVDVMVINSTAILITWGYPVTPSGIIQGYIIQYGAANGNLMLDPDTILTLFNHTLVPVNDMTNQSVAIESLKPFTHYVFEVAAYAFSDDGDPFRIHEGVFSPPTAAVQTGQAAPSAPTNFQLQPVTNSPTQLSATWSTPVPTNGIINNYTISCSMLASETDSADDADFQVFASTSGTTSVTINDLTAFTFYQCYVTASTSAGEGPPSNNSTERTVEDVPNAPPQNVIATPLSSTSLNVTWLAPPLENQRGDLSNYTITYVILNSGEDMGIRSRQVESSVFYLELPGLEKFTFYEVNVTASTSVGSGPEGTTVVQTESDIPSAPLNLTYANETSTSISLTWQQPASPNGDIERYTLQITDITLSGEEMQLSNITDILGDTTEYMVDLLLPFHTYDLVLYALTDRGAGPGSMALIVYTLEDTPTAPQNFMLTLIPGSPTQLMAVWSRPNPSNGLITSYTIYCNTSTSQAYPEIGSNVSLDPVSVNDGDALAYNITGLEPFTNYDCQIAARTSIGEGGLSGTQMAQTTEAVPDGGPQNFMAVTITATQVTLSWSRPAIPNGLIIMYTLVYSNSTLSMSQVIPYSENVSDFEVAGLNEFTSYSFAVNASTSVGAGPAAVLNITSAEAAPNAAPLNLAISITSSTSLTVSWQPPPVPDQNGQLTNYEITYRIDSENAPESNTETSGLSIVLSNLQVFTSYVVTVSASTSAGVGPRTMETERTDSTTPAAPVSVAAPDITPTSIFVMWDSPSPVYGDIVSYSIQYSFNASEVLRIVNITVLNINLTGLMEYTNYTIRVFAFTDKGQGEPSADIVVRTDEHSPDEPTSFIATSINSTSIHLTWGPPRDPNGVITNYHLNATVGSQDLYIRTTGVENITDPLGGSDLMSYTLTGLHPYVLYQFRLSASTLAGMGTATVVKEAMTEQAAPAEAVREINATTDNSTAVTLSWLPPHTQHWNGPITSYTIEYTPVNNCQEQASLSYSAPVPTNGTISLTPEIFVNDPDPRQVGDEELTAESSRISGLEEFVSYTFLVTIANTVGDIVATDVGCAITDAVAPSVPPPNVSFNITSNTTAVVEWEELPVIHHNGIVANYTVRLSNGSNTTVARVSTSDTLLNLMGLIPNTVYTVEVTAVNQIDEGPYSQPKTGKTLEGLPEPPRNLQLSVNNTTSVRVSWESPEVFFGVPSFYFITYRGSKVESQDPITVSTSSQMTTLTGLIGDNTYSVSVRASTSAGVGGDVSGTVDLPKGASPVVEVTDNTLEIVPIISVDDTGKPKGLTHDSFSVVFNLLPVQQVNGPVDRVWIFAQRQPSNNKEIGTYYDSNVATSNWPKYPAQELLISSNGVVTKRKKRATGTTVPGQVGGTDDCGPNDIVCNGPLVANTDYSVGYRLYSGNESSDYEFQNATYRTAVDPSASLPIIIGAVIGVILVVTIIVVIFVLVIVCVRRKKSGKFIVGEQKNGGQKLLPRGTGNGSNVPFLGPSDPNIVPIQEMQQVGGGGAANPRFPMPLRSNTRKIYLKDFNSYLQDMLDDSGYKFSEEYERVTEIGLDHAKEASLMAENRAKNRYTNILAYDHSRVKLSFVDDEPGSDYINACYIPGYRMRRAYVATQGPLPATFDDFWRMVWEQNSHVIVMLTQLVERGRTKCHRYWPGTDPSVYGDIAVELISEKEKEDWTVREFKLSAADRRSRLVRHFQFTSWPDHGVPDTPIAAIDFVKTVRTFVDVNHGPLTVHCSAGVGRTGCFVALDTLLQQLNDHDWIDVFGLACEMRQHRNHMIQTEAQYVFIHKAMQEIVETESSFKPGGGGFSQSGFSQSGGYPSLYVNQFTEDNTQMTDYYDDFLSEETHM